MVEGGIGIGCGEGMDEHGNDGNGDGHCAEFGESSVEAVECGFISTPHRCNVT